MANNRIDMTVGLKVDKSGLNQLKKSLQQMQKLNWNDLMKINGGSLDQAKQAYRDIHKQAEKVESALKAAFNPKLNTVNIEKFKSQLAASGTSLNSLYSTFHKAGSAGENAFRNLSSQLLKVNTTVKETSSLFNKMAVTFANTIKWNISSSVFNSLTGSVQQAWNFTKALDSSLNDIRIVTGQSADEMDRFAERANAVAKNLGATTKDYTNAALIYAQQGLGQKEIEEKTAITLKTANVTGQSAEAVSEQLTAVWNGYRVSAEEAEIYVDRLAAIAANSASNLQELATGMSKVASAAATMGVSEEQLAAQLSTIISVTRQAPESVGVALKTVYARISDIKAGLDENGVSLGNYSGKMAAFGINVLDMNGNLRDMGEVIEEIGEKWGTMTRQQQVSLAQTMGGQRQYSNLVALFDSFDKYQNMLSVAQNAEGTLEKQNETYMDRLTTHITQMTAATEELFMSLIDSDGFKTLIDIFTKLIELVSTFTDAVGGLGPILSVAAGQATKLFSKDIVQNIQRTFLNKSNKEQVDQENNSRLVEIRKIQEDNPQMDSKTQQLYDLQARLLQDSSRLSNAENEEIQGLIDKLLQATNAEAEFRSSFTQQRQQIKATFEAYKNIVGGFVDIKAMATDPQQYVDFSQNMEKLQNIYQETQSSIATISMEIEKVAKSGSALDNFETSAKKQTEQMQRILDNLGEQQSKIPSTLNTKIRKAQEALDNFQAQVGGSENGELVPNVEGLKELQRVFEELAKNVESSDESLTEILDDFREKFPELEQQVRNMRQLTEDAETAKQQAEEELASKEQIFEMQDVTQMVGGLTQVYGAMQSIANLGNIWASNDSGGQRFLKILMAFGTIIPTLITGTIAINKGLKALNLTTKQSIALKLKDIATSVSAAVAKVTEAGATGLLTIAVTALKDAFNALSLSPILLPLLAIGAAIAGIAAAVNFANESLKNQIEANNQVIDRENQKQEKLSSNKELYSSLRELNEQYKAGAITRTELKTQTEALLEQYQAQDDVVRRLTNDYAHLGETLDDLERKNLEEQVKSSTVEKNTASANVLDVAKQDDGFQWFGKYHLWAGDYSIDTAFDTESIVKAYDQAVEKLSTMTSEELTTGDGRKLADWVEKMKEPVQEYKASIEELDQYQTEFQAMSDELDFSNIDSATTYLEEKQALIKKIIDELGKTDEQAEKLADTYFKQNQKGLYNQFDAAAKQIKEFKEASFLSEDQKKNIASLISDLSEEQVEFFSNLDTSGIETYKELEEILTNISNKKLSHIKIGIESSDQALDAAANKYNIYNSLQQQVNKGKKISKKEYDSLLPEIQDYFKQMANGTFKMVKNAKDFNAAVNEIKTEDFKDILTATQEERASLENVKAAYDQGKFHDYRSLAETAYQNKPEKNGAEFFKDSDGEVDQEKVQKVAQQAISKILDEQGQVIKGYQDTYDWLSGLIEKSKKSPDTVVDSDLSTLSNYTFAGDDDKVQQQLDYLEATVGSNEQMRQQVAIWRELAKQGKLTEQQYAKIAEAVGDVGDKTVDLDKKISQYSEREKKAAKQLHDAMFPTDSDVDTKALSSLTDVLQSAAKDSKDLADGLSEDRDAAEDVAESILRFDDAIKDVTKNYKTWKAALDSKSYQDLAKVLPKLRDAYADLLDLDGSSLSDDFLKSADNLELMRKAANGNVDAYNQLQELAGQDIAIQVGLNKEQFEADKNWVYDSINQLTNTKFDDLQVGASLNDADFLAGLTDMVNSAHMTAEQATDYLASMGVDADVIEEKRTEKVKSTYTDAIADVKTEDIETTNPATGQPTTIKVPSIKYDIRPSQVQGEQENAAFSLKVTSAKKSSGGGLKFKQSSRGAGSGKSSRKGGKKGGGGNKADKSQKDTKKTDKKQQDIYHDINIELKDINRALERTQKIQEKLYGKELLDNLQKQSDLLDEHIKKLREKEALQKTDLKNKQAELKTLGMTFDEYGHITNYLEKLIAHQNKINKLTEEYNAIVKKYNASTNKSTKEKLNQQMTAKDKQIKQAEEAKKETEEKIKGYEELQDEREELLDQIEEELDKQIEIAIKKFRMQLEVRLETGDAEREWNDFKRNVLNADDVLKTSSFSTIMRDAQNSLEDFGSYFDVAGAKGSIAILTEQVRATKQQIEDIDKLGESAIYGKNKAQAMEDLKTDLSDLMSKLGEVQELIKALDQAYLDGMADIKEQYSNRQEQLGFIGELVQHDMDLLGIIFGSKNYTAMQKYYETLRQNQNSQINLLREESNYWKDKWEQALRNGNTNAAKQFENNYKDSINNLNSLLDTAAQTLKDKYLNAIDAIFDQINNKLTSGKGLDYLDLEWDLINKNAESYLDKINSAYAIQDFQNKSTKAINDAKGLKNQQALKKVSEEQLKILRNKDKLTQYDVDRANKMLELEKARLALEEARQNKTSLRLKRDSQGNYSYQYISDNNKILEAQEALAKAQNELFNFDAQKYKDNLKEVSEAWKEYQKKVRDILQDEALSEQERSNQLKLVKDKYETYITNKLKENLSIRENLMQSAFDEYSTLYDLDAQKFANISAAEKDVIMNELVPQWDSGIADMISRLNGDGEQQGLAQAWEDTFEQIKVKEQEFKQEQAELFKEAGINPEDLQNAFNPIADIYSDLIGTNKEFLDQLNEEKSALKNIASQAEKLKEQYKGIFEYAKKSAEEAQKFRTQQEKAAAAAAQTVDKTKSKANAQADTKAAQQKAQQTVAKGTLTSVSKASVNGGGGGSRSNNGGVSKTPSNTRTPPKGDKNFNALKDKYNEISKKYETFKAQKSAMGNNAFFGTNSDKSYISSIEKLKKDLDKYVGKVTSSNSKSAKQYQQNAANILATIKSAKKNATSAPGYQSIRIGSQGFALLNSSVVAKNKGRVGFVIRKQSDGKAKYLYAEITNQNGQNKHRWLKITSSKLITDPAKFKSLDTGGYTGNWADQQGRLALLHKKELVLNAKDTKNMLDMVTISKKTLNGLRSKSSLSLPKLSKTLDFNTGAIEQNVHITASFPNVNSKREIEEAFNDLVNLAAQRAMKR